MCLWKWKTLLSTFPHGQKQYTNIDKLDRRIMTTLIDSKSTNETGVTRQHITVNYKFVGQLIA
ncbi:MAG: DUF4368 domain-containing protein [Eubacteriales bacterium]|nr:DUF4368 domain-containing protein [Eubacteriales bacterium]